MTNTTKVEDGIGKFLRFAIDDPVFNVWLGLWVMTLGILMFGIHGSWWYLLLLPAGSLSLAGGVAEQKAQESK